MRLAKKQLKAFGECSREMKAVVKDNEEFGEKIQVKIIFWRKHTWLHIYIVYVQQLPT